ncbi:hypothetical protein A0O34_05255 [Chryseobacterium glaciei]|uniref:Helix-turn-helix domain-containing protein n=1 Tax=Chryseobacterium glaciei TaxID=1685010 RepID=A0A172XSW3_9FLAO|nr:helix-turn-helix domain-containing protein [Chryseobacterium glaciei]ANF49970.1 hypothetical protein A0O34_05255 [Chryseobacterium glaciei]
MENNILLQKLNELENKIDSLSLSTKEILTLDEAVNYLQISRSYLYKLTSSKEISHYKPSGKLIYFKKSDLDFWLLRNKESNFTEISNDLIQNLKDRRNGND